MNSMQPHLLPYATSAQRIELFHNTADYQQSYSGSETDVSTSASTENLSHEEKYVLRTTTRQEPQGEENLDCTHTVDQASFNTLIIHKNCGSDDYYKRGSFLRNVHASPVPTKHHMGMLHNARHRMDVDTTDSDRITDSGSDTPDSTKSKSTGEMLPYDLGKLPPPPAYRARVSSERDLEKASKFVLSRSQPDLTHCQDSGMLSGWKVDGACKSPQFHERPKTRGRAMLVKDHDIIEVRKAEMVELLVEENAALKAELEIYFSKVSKLQKFEHEIQKVYHSYGDLEKSSEKRDRLSRAVRMKLEMEIKRLQGVNNDLKAQLDLATSQLCKRQSHEIADSELRRELNRRDLLIAQLINQNKELVAAKERQEIELAAQRATLQEQRTHIDILDSALTNAQGNVVKLEEECRKKQMYVNRVEQLQKALMSLQMASDKREQMEKKLRNQLEKEIQELRKAKDEQCSNTEHGSNEAVELKRQLREIEEKMMATQAEVTKWEQRYLEESAMRQIAIDQASMPKDAKIAALEQTSQESERLIAQARVEKLKQMDELHAINKRCADYEGRLKDLESKLAEKEAMIKVLQKHSIEKDFAYQNAILRSPRHTPHSSLHEKNFLTPSTDISDSAAAGNVASLVTTISTLSITNTTASLTLAKMCSDIQESECGVDEQLKGLDSELLSKDSIIHALRAEKEKYPNHFWRV